MDDDRPSPARRFLFVCGTPRSGTTALATLLNLHPAIAIGIERFKTLSSRTHTQAQFTPAVFEHARFFDLRPEDTNIRAEAVYRALEPKYDAAAYVGDKVPGYYRKLPLLVERFGDPHIIYILRDAAAVARSWNTRADDPDDRWPAANDYRRAVADWNSANRLAARHHRAHPDTCHIVVYDELFPFGIHVIAALMDRLRLPLDRDFLRRYHQFATAPRREREASPERPEQADYVAEHADHKLYARLRRAALR